MTIHITGHRANTAPLHAAASAICTGIAQIDTAIKNATTRPAKAACHAGRLSIPSSTRTVTIGSSATRNDSPKLPPTGVNNWWNITPLFFREIPHHVVDGVIPRVVVVAAKVERFPCRYL